LRAELGPARVAGIEEQHAAKRFVERFVRVAKHNDLGPLADDAAGGRLIQSLWIDDVVDEKFPPGRALRIANQDTPARRCCDLRRAQTRRTRSHYGYKAHVGVDQGSGLVRRLALTPAHINDTVMGEAMICGDEQALYADKAYDSHARRARLQARGIADGIMHRPNKHHPVLSPEHKAINRAIAPIRSQVETTFAVWKRHYGFARVRYFSLRRNLAQLYLMAIASNLRRVLVLC